MLLDKSGMRKKDKSERSEKKNESAASSTRSAEVTLPAETLGAIADIVGDRAGDGQGAFASLGRAQY